MTDKEKGTLWIFWPFIALWRLLTFILELTGRLLAIVLGGVLMIIGVVMSLTVVGAVVGVPIAIFGFLLVMRGLF
ncbi:MAG: hypothetical protein A2Z14_08985 [Chloroflexi bacterium RBG_16_48_8]|nr:MAG: hypothetical protein A2Z14_08985 [Chloroflexi bacterium RBG_16_48_8]